MIGSLVGAPDCHPGALLGDFMDMKALEDKSELLAKASEFLVDGEASLLLNRQRRRHALHHHYGMISL